MSGTPTTRSTAVKVWEQLKREGIEVARCTVERLMRRLGPRGVVCGKAVRTTASNPAAPCPLDRIKCQFTAGRSHQLRVSDFTYVSTLQGLVYVAFVIDVFAGYIIGWRVSRTMNSDFVLDVLEQALYARQSERAALIHHRDRGSQYVSIRYSERLAERVSSHRSVALVTVTTMNALAETINSQYKAEVIHRLGPWKSAEAVEWDTLQWVPRFNTQRLMEPLGYIPLVEAKLRQTTIGNLGSQPPLPLNINSTASAKTGAVQKESSR